MNNGAVTARRGRARVSLRCESVMTRGEERGSRERERRGPGAESRVSGRLEIRERERREECQKWTLDSHEDIMRRGAGALPDHRDFLMFLCPQSLTLTTTSHLRPGNTRRSLN